MKLKLDLPTIKATITSKKGIFIGDLVETMPLRTGAIANDKFVDNNRRIGGVVKFENGSVIAAAPTLLGYINGIFSNKYQINDNDNEYPYAQDGTDNFIDLKSWADSIGISCGMIACMPLEEAEYPNCGIIFNGNCTAEFLYVPMMLTVTVTNNDTKEVVTITIKDSENTVIESDGSIWADLSLYYPYKTNIKADVDPYWKNKIVTKKD